MIGGIGPMTMLNDYPAHSNCCRIQIVAPIGMTQGYLTKLFNLIPGMEYCDLNESTGKNKFSESRCTPTTTPTAAFQKKNRLYQTEVKVSSQYSCSTAHGVEWFTSAVYLMLMGKKCFLPLHSSDSFTVLLLKSFFFLALVAVVRDALISD